MVRTALRLAQSATRAASFRTITPSARCLHSSAARFASEVPRDPFADPKIQAFQDKLQSSPDAMNAVMNVAKVLQSKGIDTSQGPPSAMQMMKLGLDSEVRTAVANMMEECRKAGVEIDQKALAERFQQK